MNVDAMSAPGWKKMAEELRAKGIENPHAKRLEMKIAALTGGGTLEAEMISEMASSLRRAEDRILTTLLELDVIDRRIGEAHGAGRERDVPVLVAKYNKRRDDAREYVRDLTIQREAIGFNNNEMLASLYPIPPAKK